MTPNPGYQSRVTFGLLFDTLDTFRAHGIDWADAKTVRKARALEAVCHLADAIAGPIDRGEPVEQDVSRGANADRANDAECSLRRPLGNQGASDGGSGGVS